MRLYIDCAFDDGDQTLIVDNASDADFAALQRTAASGEGVVIIAARVTEHGRVADRFVRADCIRSVRRASA